MTGSGEPRRLELEVHFNAQPIKGCVYERDPRRGFERPFSGWLGLMAAIDAVRSADSSPAPRTEREAP